MSFLNAEWRKLILVNYEIDPQVLLKHLPFGTELDLFEGKCYVSLVGFMFLNTKMLGMRIPFHINFEEVNLRFYVKRIEEGETKRGVVFIKEIVPKFAITTVANLVYKENYETLKMNHSWTEKDNSLFITYKWKKKGIWQSVHVKTGLESNTIPEGSETEFITEHYWGYAHINNQSATEYEVTHPPWKTYKVQEYDLKIDYGLVYGEAFSFLTSQTPLSVMLAEGSEITVESKRKIS
jgi:uncharacterized protein